MIVLPWLCAAPLFAASSLAVSACQDPPARSPTQVQAGTPPDPEEVVQVTTAGEAELRRLLADHERATASDDAKQVAAALAAMSAHDNPELKPIAIAALKYKATRLDKAAAREAAIELGERSRKQIDLLLEERIASVQVAAAHVLANYPDDKSVIGALGKAFKDKKLRKERPLAFAALIRAYGILGHDRVEDEVMKELAQPQSKEVARACVRYLGQLPTRDYENVLELCGLLEAPQPAAVDDPSNPPAEYWAAIWEQWNWTRRDVTWSLKQITGQVFRPAEGEHPSDLRKALEYVKANKRELGLK
jgi:hypothetical protein